MGNSIGKKKKLGSAASAKWVAPEVQVKKDGLSPLARSYSMPVHHAKPKSDNYHVVALTSSTYGILKVDLPKNLDESRTSMSQSRAMGDLRGNSEGIHEKVRKFEIPEIVVPKPWSDEMLSNFKVSAKEGGKVKKRSDAPMTIHEEEPEIINTWEMMEGLDEDFRSPSPLVLPPIFTSPKPSAPLAFHKKVRSLDTSLSFSSIHTVTEVDVDFLEGVVKSGLKKSLDSEGLIKGRTYTPRNLSHVSAADAAVAAVDKENARSLSSSRHVSGKENVISCGSVPLDASFANFLPVMRNSLVNVMPSGLNGDLKRSNTSTNPKSVAPLPKPPNKEAVVGVDNALPNFNKLSLTSNSASPKGLVGAISASPKAAQKRLEQVKSQDQGSDQFCFANTVFSPSDDSENHSTAETPLFDPELLASFDVSEDEWYRVRRSDAGIASTSGSSSEGERSPVRADDVNSNSSSVEEASPLVRNPEIEANSQIDVNSRKMSFSKVAPVDFRDAVPQKARKADPFENFETKCPPGGEDRVVIYVTSLRGIRKTFEDCSHMKLVILGYRVAIDERDVSMHADFRQELKDLMGMAKSVPRLFIKGRYIGGAEEVNLLHEDGTLAKLLDTMPTQTSWEQCDGCGGHRFIPCSNCSGSCKIVTEENDVIKCTECNENGLVRCPICF